MAQALISDKEYDLILMDVSMPVMSVRDIYDYIRKNHPELVPRIVVTSGDLIGGDTWTLATAIGCPFLPEPFTLDELKAIAKENSGRL